MAVRSCAKIKMVKGRIWHITLLNKQGELDGPWNQGGIVAKSYCFARSVYSVRLISLEVSKAIE